jgi:hypothetical protein
MTIKTPHMYQHGCQGLPLRGTFAMKTKLCDWIGSVKTNQKTTKQTVKLKRAFRVAGVA